MRLRELRQKSGKSLEQVAADLGWTNTATLSRLETGKQNTKLSTLAELATYYGVSVPDLFEYDGTNPLKRLAWAIPEEHAAFAAELLETYVRHLHRQAPPN